MKHESISVIDKPSDQQLPAGEISGADSLIDMSAFERQFDGSDESIADEIARLEREVFGYDRTTELADVAIAAVNEKVHPVTRTTVKEQAPDETDAEAVEMHAHKTGLRRFGLHALRSFKNFDAKFAYVNARVISALPGTKSMEERAAHQEMLNEKFAASEDDSFLRARYKTFRRNTLKVQERASPLVLAMGAAAISRYMPAITEVIDSTTNEIADFLAPNRTLTIGQELAANSIDYMPVQKEFKSVSVVTPGHWDGDAQGMYDAMVRQGEINNQNLVMKNKYSAEMATPFTPGDRETTEESIAPAIRNIVDSYNKTPKDTMFTSYGFSQGSYASNRAAWEIINANGGVKPDNFQHIAYGSPVGPTGIQNNAFAQFAKPFTNAMGIPLDEKPAPGTIFITNRNDVIGNGANQSGLASLLMAADFGNAHNLDRTAGAQDYVTVIYGEDGTVTKVVDNVHPVAEMLAVNNGIHLQPGYNEALQHFVPINDGSSRTVPRPNAPAGIMAIANQIGHDVNNPAAGQMVGENINKYYGNGAQRLADAVNSVPTQIATGDIQGAMDGFNNGVQGFAEVINPQNAVKFAEDTVHDGINQGIANLPPEQRPFVEPFADFGRQIADSFFATLNSPPRQ